jgi:hypothetical protein
MKAFLIKLLPFWTWTKKTLWIIHSEPVILTSMGIAFTNLFSKAFFNKYFISDWEFVGYLGVMVVIDTILGVGIALKDNDFSSGGFSGFFVKVVVYTALLVCVNILTGFTIKGEHPGYLDLTDDVLYGGIIIRESISVIEKAGKIRPGLVPPWIAKRLKELNNDGPK